MDGYGEAFVRVRRQGGLEGWVAAGDVRSPLAYRAGFAKVNGQWRMVFLVQGDQGSATAVIWGS